MAGFRLLHRIHGEAADGVGEAPCFGLLRRSLVLIHVNFSATVLGLSEGAWSPSRARNDAREPVPNGNFPRA